MGAWGTGIFSNDTSCDVRDDFRDLIADGLTADEATSRLESEYEIQGDIDVDHDFWLGLAATQHRTGHVVPRAIENALQVIDDPAEVERWEPSSRRKRAAALAKLQDTLAQPAPPPRKIRKRKLFDTQFAVGQHVVLEQTGPPSRVLLRIVDIHQDAGGRYPVAVVVAWAGTEESLHQAHRLPSVPIGARQVFPRRAGNEALGFILIDKPPDLRVLAVKSDRRTPQMKWESRFVIGWKEIGEFLAPDGTAAPWPGN